MNDDFKLKKTRMIVVASIVWVVLSFILADTYSSYGGFFHRDFDFNEVAWGIFILCASPVGIYWAYYWINKGR